MRLTLRRVRGRLRFGVKGRLYFLSPPDLAARALGGVKIIEVGDKHAISDGKREVSAYFLENPHSTAYLTPSDRRRV